MEILEKRTDMQAMLEAMDRAERTTNITIIASVVVIGIIAGFGIFYKPAETTVLTAEQARDVSEKSLACYMSAIKTMAASGQQKAVFKNTEGLMQGQFHCVCDRSTMERLSALGYNTTLYADILNPPHLTVVSVKLVGIRDDLACGKKCYEQKKESKK